jgi:hypothetical protein
MSTSTHRDINPVLLATSALNDAALCFAAASSILASRKLLLLSANSDSIRLLDGNSDNQL